MKFPICSKCLRRKLICDSCADVVADFGIKHKEIEMMRKLHKKMKNYEILKKVEIRRAVDNGNMVVIIADRESASLLIGRDGGMIKQLGREIGRHIRVVPISSTPEEFIRELFHNTHILGVNVVFAENGKTYRIRIPRNEISSLPLQPEDFSEISSLILNEEVQLEFV